MIEVLFSFLPANIKKSPLLYVLTIVGVALGTASVCSIQLLNRSALQTFDASVKALSGAAEIEVRSLKPWFSEQAITPILETRGVADAWPVIKVQVAVFDGFGRKSVIDLVGIDSMVPRHFSSTVSGDSQSLASTASVVLPEGLASKLGLAHQEKMMAVWGVRKLSMKVKKLIPNDSLGPMASTQVAFMDIAQLQHLLGVRGQISAVMVVKNPASQIGDLRQRLQRLLAQDMVVQSISTQQGEARNLLGAFRLNLSALSMISFLVGLFLIWASIQAAVLQRRLELGVLRSLGMTQVQVFFLVVSETATISLLGVAIGIPAGYCAAWLNLSTVSQTISNVYLLKAIENLPFDWFVISLGLGVGVGGGMLGGVVPAWLISRQSPKILLGEQSPAKNADKVVKRLFLIGLGQWLVSIFLGEQLREIWSYSGFFMAVSTLFAIIAITPALLCIPMAWYRPQKLGITYAARSLGQRRLSGNSLVLAALAITLCMTTGLTVMIKSFEATLSAWIDRVVIADIYLRTATVGKSAGGFSQSVMGQVASYNGTVYLDTLRQNTINLGGEAIKTFGVDFSIPDTVSRFPFIGDVDFAMVTKLLLKTNGVLVTEPLARRYGLKKSSLISLYYGGSRHEYRVAGVFRDYSSEKGLIYMHKQQFQQVFGRSQPSGLAVYLKPQVKSDAAIAELKALLSDIPGLDIRSNRDLKKNVMTLFEQTFAVTHLLQFMALLIASFGILLALLILATEERGEVSLLRGLGAQKKQIWFLYLFKGIMLAVLATFLGWLGGGFLAYVLIDVLNPDFFGWSLKVEVPFAGLLLRAGVVICVAGLASVYPAFLASKSSVRSLSRDAL